MMVAIMQPTYLPWAGYFSMINKSDCFVFLDDVQYARRSWQTRNRISINGVEHIISVSTVKAPRDRQIKDIFVHNEICWRKDHQKTIDQAYSKAPYGRDIVERVSNVLADESLERLADLNITIIREITNMLGITASFIRLSELKCSGKRSEYLIDICRRVGATSYLSPEGSRGYLIDDGYIDWLEELPLIYHNFDARPYPQHGVKHFIPYLSVIDVIANLGVDGTREYLGEGCRL
jgi:hypothetical protein